MCIDALFDLLSVEEEVAGGGDGSRWPDGEDGSVETTGKSGCLISVAARRFRDTLTTRRCGGRCSSSTTPSSSSPRRHAVVQRLAHTGQPNGVDSIVEQMRGVMSSVNIDQESDDEIDTSEIAGKGLRWLKGGIVVWRGRIRWSSCVAVEMLPQPQTPSSYLFRNDDCRCYQRSNRKQHRSGIPSKKDDLFQLWFLGCRLKQLLKLGTEGHTQGWDIKLPPLIRSMSKDKEGAEVVEKFSLDQPIIEKEMENFERDLPVMEIGKYAIDATLSS
ncbi:hypothetical protein LXL04_010967 [Taraxacum kok-saghyz]